MLNDDAVDKSTALLRQTHIQLHAARVVQEDVLRGKVDEPEKYFMEKMALFTQSQSQSIGLYVDNQQCQELSLIHI